MDSPHSGSAFSHILVRKSTQSLALLLSGLIVRMDSWNLDELLAQIPVLYIFEFFLLSVLLNKCLVIFLVVLVVNDLSSSHQVYSPHEVLYALYNCQWRASQDQQVKFFFRNYVNNRIDKVWTCLLTSWSSEAANLLMENSIWTLSG